MLVSAGELPAESTVDNGAMATSGANNVYIHTVSLQTKAFLNPRYRQGVLTQSSLVEESAAKRL